MNFDRLYVVIAALFLLLVCGYVLRKVNIIGDGTSRGLSEIVFSKQTEIGALAHYVSEGGVSSSFQPMNANFGIIAPFDKKIKGGKKARNAAYAERSALIIKERFSHLKDK